MSSAGDAKMNKIWPLASRILFHSGINRHVKYIIEVQCEIAIMEVCTEGCWSNKLCFKKSGKASQRREHLNWVLRDE